MKKALTLVVAWSAFSFAALAYTSPGNPTGFVNDFAGIISPSAEAALNDRLAAYERETGNEVVVATVPSLGGDDIETFAVELFEEWGIGKERQDNGALLLVAPNDREARIEVGYGLEPYLTDVATSIIMNETLLPAFRAGDYEAGIVSGADRMVAGLIGAEDLTTERAGTGATGQGGLNANLLGFVFVILLQLIPVVIYSKSWWLGGVIGLILGFIVFGSIAAAGVLAVLGLAADFILSKMFAGKGKGPGGRPGAGVWFGGLGGGGGFGGRGGGFGGFGGGMSGGGGSSGRW